MVLYFNPIIVLFLTKKNEFGLKRGQRFQSYYSLISNNYRRVKRIKFYDFNPIIVLFLTFFLLLLFFVAGFQSYYSLISNDTDIKFIRFLWFQSYYSLISNKLFYCCYAYILNFNPIIVLFLTTKPLVSVLKLSSISILL